ncbi:hypothetical protein BDV11DRAFT_207943 [Aspergillus similis]
MDDIDEADQMPVEATLERSNPLCYICCWYWATPVKWMTTDRKSLVLFHPRLCATALRDEASAAELTHAQKQERLRGLVIHARCWQVLVNHKIWVLTEGDISLIMEALRRRSTRNWRHKALGLDGMKLHENMSAVAVRRSPRVWRAIHQARRRTRARFFTGRQYRTLYLRLDRLPAEILFLIANRLPSSDVVAVQEAMGLYFGDAYWRSRIPSDFFHEVKDLAGQTLDWEYLCLKLELLDSRHYGGKAHKELLGRHWVLRQLDEVAKFIVH